MTEEVAALTHRQEWLKDRTKAVIDNLSELEDLGDWETYMTIAHELAKELIYAVTEWEKYYK